MDAMVKPTKVSYASARIRGQTDFLISKGKLFAHLGAWLAVLLAMAWVFILPYQYISENDGRVYPHQLVESMGDEIFLIVGAIICSLIIWYIAVLAAKLHFKGPLYRVSSEGLWLCQANHFFVSRKAIRSIYIDYKLGKANTVVLELNDRHIVEALQSKLPKLVGVTCDDSRSAICIALVGLENKRSFTRSLSELTRRVR